MIGLIRTIIFLRIRNMRKIFSRIYKKIEKGEFFYFRKFILITADQVILFLSLFFSYLIHGIIFENISSLIVNFAPIFFNSLIIFIFTGQYRVLTKYAYSVNIYKIAARNLAVIFLTLIFTNIFSSSIINLEILFSFCFISTGLISLLRSIFSWLIRLIQNEDKSLKNVIIFGAGAAGAQLATTIKLEKNFFQVD